MYHVSHYVLEKIKDPEWDEKHFYKYDWRTYIPNDIREVWGNLTLETKKVVYRVAQEAGEIEWYSASGILSIVDELADVEDLCPF